VVRARLNAEVEAARREADAAEIAAIPRARLEPLFLDFGLVSGDMRREATLINTGQVSTLLSSL
jgi:hypothetical protein